MLKFVGTGVGLGDGEGLGLGDGLGLGEGLGLGWGRGVEIVSLRPPHALRLTIAMQATLQASRRIVRRVSTIDILPGVDDFSSAEA
ncbi:hypothetical protein QQS45_08760 [Alteriqipengyuania flavescens]|uniref:hypothetical protein n=1 Tax=Alteriqipengyuania flavescens TaxID=3053610 RepID=UPI0025B3630E|nr:hypothetical protein [Alteriqipengyuania flavescens]WJY20105.1 hypothetical protein QQW98_08755 [Alteriqipengyuania flavescens]WJY26048.1 hypothetical protein QQS45_08760 [Alteriqipengyuania flavescens]